MSSLSFKSLFFSFSFFLSPFFRVSFSMVCGYFLLSPVIYFIFFLIYGHFLFLQISERVRGESDLDDEGRQMSFCASGLHPNGTCSCGSFFTAEEPSIHASIFQILMLADALFEVDFLNQIMFYFLAGLYIESFIKLFYGNF